jgi:hypothetical protein
MDPTKLISAAVGPVVIMSSCGLLCSTFYTRISNVITRLRVFQRERLAEQSAIDRETDAVLRKRRQDLLNVLGTQTTMMILRVRLIRTTLFCLLLTILCLAASSLSLGLSVLYEPALYPAVALFVIGILSLMTAILFAILDLRLALRPVVLEAAYVSKRLQGDEGV